MFKDKDVMSTSKDARSKDEAKVALEEESKESTKRTLTEKGYLYQHDLKTSKLKTKKYCAVEKAGPMS